MTAGVYVIENTANGHRYVGSACNLTKRRGLHWHDLRRGTHHSGHLQRAFLKYGEPAFVFRTILRCDKKNLILFEQRAIDALRPEYNISPTAGSPLGVRHTPETRAKVSEAARGRKASPEARANMSASHMGNRSALGYRHTRQTLEKLSMAMRGNEHAKGYRFSSDAKAKLSEAHRGNKNALGFRHTDETKARISEASRRMWANRKMEEAK